MSARSRLRALRFYSLGWGTIGLSNLSMVAIGPICPHSNRMPKQPRARKIFLSHKQEFAREADELHAALKLAVPAATVFQSEDIEKSEDFRAAVDWQLDRA